MTKPRSVGDVWLFFHADDRSRTRSHRDHIESVCHNRGWAFQPKPVDRCRSSSGRPLPLIDTAVAAHLYPRLHRQRVVVLVIGRDPLVPLHPNIAEAVRPRRHVPLRRYIAYKSLWIRLPFGDPTNESWAGSFSSWCATIDCEGERDPRCLPFHIFSGDGEGLENAERRAQFDDCFGSGASRTDLHSGEWRMAPAHFHAIQSADQLQVSGHYLRRGCHWDVAASGYRISTPRGVWIVDGHVNVYPDAHVRGHRPAVKQLV